MVRYPTLISLYFKFLPIQHKCFSLGKTRFQIKSKVGFSSLNSIPISSFYTNSMKNQHLVTKKLDSEEFKSILTSELDQLVTLFQKHKYDIRIAGGAVRDLLMKKIPKDVDFATTATPEEMKEMFELEKIRMINMKGEKHGTITARIGEQNFEVTTLRIDKVTDGRHAEVEFTKDWEVDASRRDLTMNAMFLDTKGVVYDYFGGEEHLKQRKLVFVGDANNRIKEDYLRILRYFRFYGRIAESSDKFDEDTIKAISSNILGLERITGERIWMEMSKILSGKFVENIVKALISVGAAPYIGFPSSPNIIELEAVCQNMKKTNGVHPITILSSLLNNLDELMKFHERCKLSTYEKNLGQFLIEHRIKEEEIKRLLEESLKYYQVLMFKAEGKHQDIRNYIIELLKYKGHSEVLENFETWDPPKMPMNGHLLKEKNIPPGKLMGKVMKKCKDYWIDNDFKPTQDEILEKVDSFLEEVKIQQSKRK